MRVVRRGDPLSDTELEAALGGKVTSSEMHSPIEIILRLAPLAKPEVGLIFVA